LNQPEETDCDLKRSDKINATFGTALKTYITRQPPLKCIHNVPNKNPQHPRKTKSNPTTLKIELLSRLFCHSGAAKTRVSKYCKEPVTQKNHSLPRRQSTPTTITNDDTKRKRAHLQNRHADKQGDTTDCGCRPGVRSVRGGVHSQTQHADFRLHDNMNRHSTTQPPDEADPRI